jgi:hypothetical protein
MPPRKKVKYSYSEGGNNETPEGVAESEQKQKKKSLAERELDLFWTDIVEIVKRFLPIFVLPTVIIELKKRFQKHKEAILSPTVIERAMDR